LQRQAIDVRAVDLIERAEAAAVVGAGVRHPLLRVARGVGQPFARHLRLRRYRRQTQSEGDECRGLHCDPSFFGAGVAERSDCRYASTSSRSALFRRRSSYAGINDRSSWVSDFNVFLSRLWTCSLESINCTVNVSSFIGTPTIVRPSAVTAVTVSYLRVAPAKLWFCVSRRLGSRIDSTR